MDKKMYFEPKEEVIFLQMSSALLAGSNEDPSDEDEPVVIPGTGGTGDLG